MTLYPEGEAVHSAKYVHFGDWLVHVQIQGLAFPNHKIVQVTWSVFELQYPYPLKYYLS
jgi:hypothetical protein